MNRNKLERIIKEELEKKLKENERRFARHARLEKQVKQKLLELKSKLKWVVQSLEDKEEQYQAWQYFRKTSNEVNDLLEKISMHHDGIMA